MKRVRTLVNESLDQSFKLICNHQRDVRILIFQISPQVIDFTIKLILASFSILQQDWKLLKLRLCTRAVRGFMGLQRLGLQSGLTLSCLQSRLLRGTVNSFRSLVEVSFRGVVIVLLDLGFLCVDHRLDFSLHGVLWRLVILCLIADLAAHHFENLSTSSSVSFETLNLIHQIRLVFTRRFLRCGFLYDFRVKKSVNREISFILFTVTEHPIQKSVGGGVKSGIAHSGGTFLSFHLLLIAKFIKLLQNLKLEILSFDNSLPPFVGNFDVWEQTWDNCLQSGMSDLAGLKNT